MRKKTRLLLSWYKDIAVCIILSNLLIFMKPSGSKIADMIELGLVYLLLIVTTATDSKYKRLWKW